MEENNGQGRPSKYDPKFDQQMIDYFNRPLLKDTAGSKPEAEELPQFVGFAQSIGVGHASLARWRDEHPSFREAYNQCKKLQEQMLVGNSIQNRYNPYFAQFMLKNCHNWKDKQDVEQTSRNIEIKLDPEDVEL